jgi:signal transduction histidine kinase
MFAVILLWVFMLSDFILSKNLLSRVDEHLMEEVNEIAFLHQKHDLGHVEDEILMESKSEGVENVFYRFLPSYNNQFTQSDLNKWQGFDFQALDYLKPDKGKVYFNTMEFGANKEKVRILMTTLDDDSFVQIGIKLNDYNELRFTYRKVFGLSVLFMMLMGIVLGWSNAQQAMRGVKRITQTAKSISKGKFDQRVSLGNEGKEIDELGHVFNEMITKVQTLVEEMKDITNSIAHDLRGPITRIRGLAETTMTGKQDIEEYRQMAGLAVEECDRLEGIIDTLLEIAEADAGLVHVPKNKVDIVKTVKDGCELFGPVMEDKGILFKLDVPEVPVFLLADITRLQRVISNLLDNAIKFTPNNGSIEVRLKDYKGHVEIIVIDSGIGINKNEISHVFDRFYRGDRSRSFSGNGLGLSLVKSIVQTLNGEVAVQSIPEKGSTFTVILPKEKSLSSVV